MKTGYRTRTHILCKTQNNATTANWTTVPQECHQQSTTHIDKRNSEESTTYRLSLEAAGPFLAWTRGCCGPKRLPHESGSKVHQQLNHKTLFTLSQVTTIMSAPMKGSETGAAHVVLYLSISTALLIAWAFQKCGALASVCKHQQESFST